MHFLVYIVGDDIHEELAKFGYIDAPVKLAKEIDYAEFEKIISIEEAKDTIFKELNLLKETNIKKYNKYKNLDFDIIDNLDKFMEEELNRIREEDFYGYYYNPNAKWDWYQIGGRWKGWFKLKNKKIVIIGESGVFGNKARYDSDVAIKKDIDVEYMKNEDKIYKEYEWSCLLRNRSLKNIGSEKYHAIWAFKNLDENCTKKEFMEKFDIPSIVPHSIIVNGEWYSIDEIIGKNAEEVWQNKFEKIWNKIDENEIITAVDCHM